jgi:hypothetical protein
MLKFFFNELSKEIREIEIISVFKNILKYYLIELQDKVNNIRLYNEQNVNNKIVPME